MEPYRFARLRGYREEVSFALEVGDGPVLRQARERLSTLWLNEEERAALISIDQDVIDQIMTLDAVQAFLLEDDATQPLDRWWWHLGKLRNRTYPAHLLPEHLRAVYLEDREERRAA